MGRRSGTADLPLHGGRVPPWLASRMARLGRVVVEALVLEYGRAEVLRRISHPFWFQSLGAVMGMDWHSSGITTSVVGALKRGLGPIADELGIYVCGGRGRHSRETPAELLALGEKLGIDGAKLMETSKLVAKVDSAAVQDGFQLYLHSFVLTADGAWTVVQQGMDPVRRQARRYHWLSEEIRSFVEEPHTAIDGPSRGEILNLTDRRAAAARAAQVELVHQDPDRVVRWLSERTAKSSEPTIQPHLIMPDHHDVRSEDVVTRRLHGVLAVAHERNVASFEELLLTPGVGARTVQSLALVSEVIHGTPSRFSDPARYSLAHGGKDGHPFPVPLVVYDRTTPGAPERGRSREARARRQAVRDPSARRRGAAPRAARRWSHLRGTRRRRARALARVGRDDRDGAGAPGGADAARRREPAALEAAAREARARARAGAGDGAARAPVRGAGEEEDEEARLARSAVRDLQLERHDGDDDGDDAVAERFESVRAHGLLTR